jgi:hypothetical protein
MASAVPECPLNLTSLYSFSPDLQEHAHPIVQKTVAPFLIDITKFKTRKHGLDGVCLLCYNLGTFRKPDCRSKQDA